MREGNLPLRTVLQNFINHVGSLEAADESNGDLHENEFQELKKFTEDLKGKSEYSTNEGEKDCNRRKNRYKDILPYDCTRVVLQDIPGVPGSDYVNANYIRGASGSRAYIASQGPLPHTVNEFWRMVVECDVRVIVMASNETEGGKHKCECYWVSVQGEEKQFGNVQVTYIKSRQVCPDFLVRTFRIKYSTEKNKNEERVICQFHYIMWPDHGIPDTVRPLLDMVRLVRDCQASETLPVLVHCSAGCGRTGTICAIDYVWGLLRTGKLNHNLDLFGLVKEMRKQRVAMVQTREQYVLLHQAVKELFRERLKLIDAHPYENISTDGNPIIPTEKESDYEELFISSEKQDKSTKASALNSTSLSKAQGLRNARDSIRRSASTSSLDSSNKPKSNQTNDRPNPLNVNSSLSPNIYQAVLNDPARSNGTHFTSQKHTKVLQNTSHLTENSVAERKKHLTPTKTEKNAENFAQLAKEKVMLCQQPRALSNLTRGTLKDQRHFVLEDPPVPPRRSRTPSPSLNSRHTRTPPNGGKVTSNDLVGAAQSKRSDISKGANIQKLKEVFETVPVSGARPVRLTRSASSVSIRPNFSVANTSTDLEDSRNTPASVVSNSRKKILLICPPPPTDPIPEHWKIKRSLTALSLVTSKPSNEYHPAIQSKPDRPTRQDERPVLPVKKSKSFRWSRQDHSTIGLKVQPGQPSPTQLTRFNNVEHDITAEVPAVKERYKLSVYQGSSDVSLSSSSSASDTHDNKPLVPPKKAIGDRYKGNKTQTLSVGNSSQLVSAPGSISEHDHRYRRMNEPLLEEKRSKASVGTQVYPNELPVKPKTPHSEDFVDHSSEKGAANSYVNAKLIKSVADEDHYSYVPLPSKRSGKLQKPYVHLNIAGLDPTARTVSVNKIDPTSADDDKTTTSSWRMTNGNNCNAQNSSAVKNKIASKSPAVDCEPIDFGETFNMSSDVFETVNFELVHPESSLLPDDQQRDFYLNKDLDTIAKQVYKDCEAYLLSSGNRSAVPSLLPTQNPVESDMKSSLPTEQPRKLSKSSDPAELEQVINKIAVPPQGLRNRERRNSYRQAVCSANDTSCGKPSDTRRSKNIHKYERIWFENDEKMAPSRSRIFQDSSSSRKLPTDYSLNINKDMNITNKDSLFKDKLEEIHLMMNDIERKHLQYLPDLSEEELSSKHSSSTSSLVSRSGQSSRSSERAEPVYVNTPGGVKPAAYLSSDKPRLKEFSVNRKPRVELESHAMGGVSHYGTLATTTSYPYRSNRVPQYGSQSTSGMSSNAHPYTATLPLRSSASPPEKNVLHAASVYRKPITHTSNKVKGPHNPQQMFAGSSKSSKPGPSTVRPHPIMHQKEHGAKKRDPLKRMEPPIKPSEVHRKRQQLNAKEPLFKPSDFPLLPSHNPIQHSMSASFFPSSQIPNRLEPNKGRNDVCAPSIEKPEGAVGGRATAKKKLSKDLNCVSSTALSDSSPEDSSADDDGVFVKFAPANILKKFRTAQVSSSKSYGKEDAADPLDNQTFTEMAVVSPPASPKTFTKAFDKFKMGSKNVAANFKSYIKGDRVADDESAPRSDNCSTSNIQSFSDVKDYKYPLPLPKKPQGTREIPNNFSSNPLPVAKKSKQQYL